MPNKKSVEGRLLLITILLSLIVLGLLFYRFGERWLRLVLIYLSQAKWARDLVSSLGLALRVARRFVAGETIDEAIAASTELNSMGMSVTLDFLGESVTDEAVAVVSREEILRLLDQIEIAGVNANVSVKLTQLGLRIRPEIALENMRLILARAREYNNQVRIDMEESDVVDTTLDLYRTLRDQDGFDNVGIVIQSYLYRSEEDVRLLVDEGAWIRLCKGAYAEPTHIAFSDKADTDASFVNLTKLMLSDNALTNGVYLGVATHDEKMIQATVDYAKGSHIPADAFEFQMLYGIRRDLQESLVAQGYRVRIYVPFGTAWYPYFVRRLAERPANLWFFISNLLKR